MKRARGCKEDIIYFSFSQQSDDFLELSTMIYVSSLYGFILKQSLVPIPYDMNDAPSKFQLFMELVSHGFHDISVSIEYTED